MKLQIRIPEKTGDPDSPEVLDAANSAAVLKATAWTAPAYVETTDGAHMFEVDAVPRADPSVVTTANVAPALLPPNVV